jgi:16S rRNA processing protein RimM
MNPPEIPPESKQAAGSPETGEPVFLVVGKLHRPHGVRGEIILEVMTDFPERLRRGVTVYLGPERTPHTLRSRRNHSQGLIVSFAEYPDRDTAASLRNQMVYVRADDRPDLPEGEYYHHQILGLQVLTETDDVLGKVTDILETGSNDVYVIRPERGPEILLPVLESVILSVDLERGEIRVRLMPGLLAE